MAELRRKTEGLPQADRPGGYLLHNVRQPRDIAKKASDAIGQAFRSPDLRARILALEADPLGSTPEQMRELIAAAMFHAAEQRIEEMIHRDTGTLLGLA